MTGMVFVYILFEPTKGFGLPLTASYVCGAVEEMVITAVFFTYANKQRGTGFVLDEDVSGYKIDAELLGYSDYVLTQMQN